MHTNKKSALQSFEFYLLILLLLSTIVPIKLSSLLIIISLAAWFLIPGQKKRLDRLKSRLKFILPFILYFVINAIGLLYSQNLDLALKDIEGKLSFVIIPILVFSIVDIDRERIYNALLIYSLIISSYLAFAIIKSFFSYQTLLVNQELSAIVGIHASYFSLYIASAFFIILSSGNRLKAFTKLALLVFLFFGIVVLAARIVLLSMIVILVYWVVSKSFNWKSVALLLFGFCIISFSVLNIEAVRTRAIEAIDFNDKVELDTKLEDHKTLGRNYGGRAIRIAIWDCAIDVVKENWLVGVGIGDVHDALQESYRKRIFEFAYLYNNYNAHNLFIETTIATGIIGLLSVIFLFGRLFVFAKLHSSLMLIGTLTVFFFLSLMESSFNVQKGVVFFCVLFPTLICFNLNKT